MKRLLHQTVALVFLWLALPLLVLVPLAQAQTGSGVFGNVGVHSGGHMGVYGTLTAVSGYVVTPRPEPTANISWQPGASHNGTSDASHVDGYAERVGNTAFTFPVGNSAVLRPAGISAPPSSGTYSAAYFATNPSSATLPTGGPFSTAALGAGVTGVSPVEYWDINGPGAVNLTLTWNAASNLTTLTGGTLSNLVIVGWDGTQWVNLGGTATGTLAGSGSITTTTAVVPNIYTAYTFGSANVTPCATPTVGGLVSYLGNLPLCTQSNVGSLTITGQTGDVVRWETSTNNGATWQPIAGSAGKASYNFVNAQNSQQYRAVVNNGTGCADVSATSATLITSNTACQTALCDSRTGSLSINVVSQSNGSNTTAQVVAVDLTGVIQAVSAPGGNGVSGLAPATYLVYHVTFDNTQTPLPTLSVGTAVSAVGGACVQWSNGLLFGVCPVLPTVAITSPAPNTLVASLNPPITGTATPGASVTVTGSPGTTGGPCVVTAANDGSWTCTSLTFVSGRNSVSAVAGNSAGRSSVASVPFVTLWEQTSYVCGTSAYLFQNLVGVPTSIVSVNLQSGASTTVAQGMLPTPNTDLNAMGYNTIDNFIWGYRLNTDQIVRVGAGFGVQPVTIAGLPVNGSFNVGDVGLDGILYLYSGSGSSTTIYRVDLRPTSPTYLTLLSSLTTTASIIADWSVSPVDGNFYTVDNTFQLLRFNPATGARTVVGAVTGTAIRATDSGFGATYMDNTGALYLSNNATGQIFRLAQPHSGSLVTTLFSTGSPSANNDGARCPSAPVLTPQPQFVCGTDAYLFQNPANVSTGVVRVNLSSGVSSTAANSIAPAPDNQLNALGYNTFDDYIWGYRVNTSQVVRIGGDFSAQVMNINGLPANGAFNVGDVNANGVLYLFSGNGTSTTIYRVDLNPNSSTYLALLPNLTTTATLMADWAFSPIDGNLYGVDNTFQLLRFNPSTGARTVVGSVTGTAIRATDSGFGAAYMDLDGSLYLGNNATGQIFRIPNPHTGGLAATLFSQGPVSANNDGARCPAAPVVDPPSVAITGPAPNTFVTTTNPPITGTATPGTSVTLTGGPGTTGGPCVVTASNTGTFTCTSLTFTPGSQTVTAIACTSVGCGTAISSFSVVAPPTLIVDPVPPTGPTTGTATPDAQIVITDPSGRTLCTTTASSSGSYSCPVTLPPSLTNIIVTACNLAGCTSQTVTPLPSLTVAPPVSPGPPTQPITGTANPGAQITITGPGPVTLCTTTASSSGTFSCPVTLPPGETNLTVTACNSASCVTQPTSRTVIGPPVVIVDPVPPTGPITGTATPGVALTLTDPTGQTLCTTTASQSGTFSCPGPLPPSLTSVIVTACNVTSCVSTTAPVRPSLVVDPPVAPGPPTQPVTGTANPGAQITLTGPGPVTLCTTTASSSGTFSCPVTLPDGITTLTVTACNAGGCTSRPVTLTVAQPPVTMPDIANTNPGTPVTGNVLTNDRDPLGLPLTASLTTPPTVGMATLNPDGSYTYTPPTGFTGTTSFCYTASNTAGHSNSACVTVNVVPAPQSALANNAPVASNLNTQTTQAVPVTVNLLANVSDPDNPGTANGQLNRPTLLSQPAQGTAVVNNDGTVTYTPPAGFTGIVSVPYQVCDKATSPLCSTALLTVNVQPTLPTGTTISPVATDGVLITPVNTPAMGTVATNSYDPQNLLLTYTAGQPQSGTVVMSSTGSYTFTPAPGFVGPVSFTYAACNSAGKCSPATVSVLVQPAPVGGLVRLNVRMLLQGALFNVGSGTLMRDDLRAGGYLPATSPYSASVSPRFSQSGGGGSETTTSAVLSVTGTNAIVDWVLVELRSAANPTLILATRSGLLQRDGDVVLPADGTSPLTFTGLTGSQYYVSVKHRNHLGVMTAMALPLSSSGTVVDFSIMTSSQIYDQPGAVNYNGNEMVTVSGRQALWAGDANADGKVKYAGTASDLTTVLNEVITAQTGNSSPTYNYDFAFGYFWGDVDLNGKVKYQGSVNDPTWIFSNVVATYILNTGPLYNYDFLVEQLP
ncbi:DUF6923 family protein [Rudanella lutea]|uniref:DUF6923 family protein n=1 Tax=Rudanella lutea TaxID=451374 RepID=UPI0003804CCD|nr:Ig-like domain-containing protein [Rudanella lutea]